LKQKDFDAVLPVVGRSRFAEKVQPASSALECNLTPSPAGDWLSTIMRLRHHASIL
jgi:hypothetical protein